MIILSHIPTQPIINIFNSSLLHEISGLFTSRRRMYSNNYYLIAVYPTPSYRGACTSLCRRRVKNSNFVYIYIDNIVIKTERAATTTGGHRDWH